MKLNHSIQIKASFLLTVFSLNTIIGFACSMGLDMGFNTTHHHDEGIAESSMHIHADGKKHIHHEDYGKEHKTEDKDNCCHEKATAFAQVEKMIPQPPHLINPVFFTSFTSIFFNEEAPFTSYVNTNIKYFTRSYHPPIPDIRIAIQSFLI